MSVAARLRKLEAGATPCPWEFSDTSDVRGHKGEFRAPNPYSGFMRVGPWINDADAVLMVSARNLLPLLADLAEAAEEAHDARCPCRKDATVPPCPMGAVLARVADQLDHEEGTTR